MPPNSFGGKLFIFIFFYIFDKPLLEADKILNYEHISMDSVWLDLKWMHSFLG